MSITAKEILEHNGLASTHWGRRIIEAEKRGRFNYIDRHEASKWTTCACGKQDPSLLNLRNEPKDELMFQCGSDFGGFVSVNDFTFAANTLVGIENRAAQLLSKQRGDL